MKIFKAIAVLPTVIAALIASSVISSAQVVALGASNTAGQGVGPSSAYPAQLQAMLQAKGSPMTVTNAGVSGDTTSGMLSRLSYAVPEGTRIVILQFGGNDFRRGGSAQERAANIASIQQQLRAKRIKVVQADALVGAALRAGMKQPDGVHLTEAGHRQVASRLLPSIR